MIGLVSYVPTSKSFTIKRLFRGWMTPVLRVRFHHVKRTLKSEPKAESCFFLTNCTNHCWGCCRVLTATAYY